MGAEAVRDGPRACCASPATATGYAAMRTYPAPGRDAIEGIALHADGSIVAVGYRAAAQDEPEQRSSWTPEAPS